MDITKYYLKLKKKLGIPFSNRENNHVYLGIIKGIKNVANIKQSKGIFEFSYFGVPMFARAYPSSDVLVANQIFIQEEYKHVVEFFKDNFPAHTKLNIIDAGANVGYASAYFISYFPDAAIVCVEPSAENVKMIEKNLAYQIKNRKIKILQNALMGEAGKNILINNDFRDGRDWALSVEETGDDSILKSISIAAVIEKQQWDEVDILKIDIEGAERFVFSNTADLSYLQKIKVLAIELHDEFNIRAIIYDILKKYDFLLLNYSQTTFFINKRFFKQ